MDDIKLVCFDLNNTLIKENSWLELNLALGMTKEEDQQLVHFYEKGIIMFEEWLAILSRIYKRSDKATLENMTEILTNYTYQPGAEDVISYLKDKSYEIALISGSIDIVVDTVAKELGINLFGANNLFFFNDQNQFDHMIVLGEDHLAKLRHLESFCRRLGIKLTQCVCIGDGINDAELFKQTQHGITFPDSPIVHLAWKTINGLPELKEIL